MLPALDLEPKLLLDEVPQRGAARAHDLVLECEVLGIARLRARVRQEKRFQVVVHGVPDKDAVIEQVCDLFLYFFEGSCCSGGE